MGPRRHRSSGRELALARALLLARRARFLHRRRGRHGTYRRFRNRRCLNLSRLVFESFGRSPLELANRLPGRAADLRQPLRAEDNERHEEHDDELPDMATKHVRFSYSELRLYIRTRVNYR